MFRMSNFVLLLLRMRRITATLVCAFVHPQKSPPFADPSIPNLAPRGTLIRNGLLPGLQFDRNKPHHPLDTLPPLMPLLSAESEPPLGPKFGDGPSPRYQGQRLRENARKGHEKQQEESAIWTRAHPPRSLAIPPPPPPQPPYPTVISAPPAAPRTPPGLRRASHRHLPPRLLPLGEDSLRPREDGVKTRARVRGLLETVRPAPPATGAAVVPAAQPGRQSRGAVGLP